MAAGYPHFHVMMALFNRHATEHFRFGSLGHKCITEHEALIIGMIRAARAGPTEEMRKAAGVMVCEGSVSHLLIAMSELGDALLHALLWPMPPILNQDNVSFRYE